MTDQFKEKRMNSLEKYIGGPAGKVIIRLLIASLILGMILSFLGLSPYRLIDSLFQLFERIYNMGFEAIEWIFEYIILGAIIVVPFWAISRAMKLLGSNEDTRHQPTENTSSTQSRTSDTKSQKT